MKKGLLITNGFVGEKSFFNLRDSLIMAADSRGIELEWAEHCRLLFDGAHKKPLFDLPCYSFGLFWDKDVRLGRQLEETGLRLFNSSRAVELCDDKSLTHLELGGKLPMPKTVFVPITFRHVGYGDMSFVDRAAEYLGLPMVIKECRGSFGKQVYLAATAEEAKEIIAAHEAVPMLMQEAVTESFGRDIRLYVVGGRVAAAMLRENPSDFRANVANGGQTRSYEPTPLETELSVRAAELLGLDFAGVDILIGREGPLICEVNSNAHFAGLERCTGADIAGQIIDHIILKTGEGK